MKSTTIVIAATLLAFAGGVAATDSVEHPAPATPAGHAPGADPANARCHRSARPAGHVTDVTRPHCPPQSARRLTGHDSPLTRPGGGPPGGHPR